jgi:hypothetical protein
MPDDPKPEIADAEWLRVETTASAPVPTPPPATGDAEAYEVAGVDEGESPVTEGTPPPRAVPTAPRPKAPRPPTLDPEEAVPQVWSRGAEWGPDLLRIGLVVLGCAVLVWMSFDLANPMPAVLLMLAGLGAALVLSYPLVITLERPIRMTPEQAVRDYFQSLAHHFPHYRRMWLLLSAAGRISGEFGSFEGFRRYWKRRLAELRGNRVAASTPLVFEIEGFKSDRSEDKRTADARFTVAVFARGRRSEGPIAPFPGTTTLARGPDSQWYLDRGTLPAS